MRPPPWPRLSRRAFLRGLAAAPGALLLACDAEPGAPLDPSPAPSRARAALPAPTVTCDPTTPDLLGPYYRSGAPAVTRLAAASDAGDPFRLVVDVRDASCRKPPPGALLELWQADADGVYHPDRLRARLPVPEDGRLVFDTIVPGRYLQASGWRPAHLHLRLTPPDAPPLVTQLYFAGDPYLAAADSCGECDSADPTRHLELRLDRVGQAYAHVRLVV